MSDAAIPSRSKNEESAGLVSPVGTVQQQPLPKCFCNWKHCRTYQKAFREFKHPFYNGVIKLKFHENDPRSLALKAGIDRTLNVETSKRNDWKNPGETVVTSDTGEGGRFCRYYVARHHFTELLMRHYLNNRRTWDWNEPLAFDDAQKFLYSLNSDDIYDDETNDDSVRRYIQVPNVPKEQVRELLKQLKEENTRLRRVKQNGGSVATSNGSADVGSPMNSPSQSSRKRSTPLLSPVPSTPRELENNSDSKDRSSKLPANSNGIKANKVFNNGSSSTRATAKSSLTKEEMVLEREGYEESDEEDSDDDHYDKDRKEQNNRGRNGMTFKSKRKQVKEDDSSSVASPNNSALLAQKEEENLKLREKLEDCENQISMLLSTVENLKEHFNLRGNDDNNSGGVMKDRTGKSSKRVKNSAKLRKKKKESVTSDENDDSDDDVDLSDVERQQQQSSSDDDRSEEETTSRSYNYQNSEPLAGNSRRQNIGDRPRNNARQSLRRGSIHSRRSIVSRSSKHVSRRGSMRGGGDDAASVMSRQSLQSISVSIKSLPREIELMDDDDEDDTRGNKDDSSYFDDTRSVGSRSAASRVSRRSLVSGSRIRNRRSTVRGGSNAANRGRNGRSSNRGAVPQEIDLSGDEMENLDVTHANVSTDTLFVRDRQIVDPYGEKGVYTGALSRSTCMPNGKGRLEYEKESRWYEGDWIHGRWTGFGRLSNGDGDFYEGGLKNDHKHGTGIMRFADGRVFEGEYIRGQMIQGKMTYQDGSVYGGSWVDGMRHGRGKCIFVDGSEYEGEFREGNFHGHGKMTWNDGGWYVGNWSNGEMDGIGKEVRPDGSLRHDGEWSGGQPIRSASDNRRRRQQQQAQSEA